MDLFVDGGILVWRSIILGSHADLEGASITDVCYCTEVLLNHLCLFRNAMCLRFLFMSDNASLHGTMTVAELLESGDIHPMDWPARFCDLNPTEYAWDILNRHLQYVTSHQQRLTLQEGWAAIRQQFIDNAVLSIER